MATEPATPDAVTQDEPENGKKPDDRPEENLRAELERRTEKQKKLEDEVAEMRNQLISFQDRDKTEVERERAARERAESQLGNLMGEVTSLKKGAWVRSAAAELNFHDPEDAVEILGGKLGDLEDEREAKRLVEKLARTKEHLVSKPEKKERPSIGRVFQGEQTQQTGPQTAQQTEAQRRAQQEQDFAEGLRSKLSEFLPENSDSWYEGKGA